MPLNIIFKPKKPCIVYLFLFVYITRLTNIAVMSTNFYTIDIYMHKVTICVFSKRWRKKNVDL